jgi:hypothetical protein
MEALEAATRSGNPKVACVALEHIAAATALAGTDSALGVLARSRALVSDGEAADELYREAIERLGRTRLRPELARGHLPLRRVVAPHESDGRCPRAAAHGP